MHAVIATEPIEVKVKAAKKAGRLTARTAEGQWEEAMRLSVITETEFAQWKRMRVLQRDVIMVDDFDKHFGKAAVENAAWRQAAAAE